jgi:hypothetical protein
MYQEPWVSITDCNEHLLKSSLMRDILTAVTVLQREPDAASKLAVALVVGQT